MVVGEGDARESADLDRRFVGDFCSLVAELPMSRTNILDRLYMHWSKALGSKSVLSNFSTINEK